MNTLNPSLKKGKWTDEEDDLIFKLYLQHGSSWSKIGKLVPDRTENSIKNRFYSTLRRIKSCQDKGRRPYIALESKIFNLLYEYPDLEKLISKKNKSVRRRKRTDRVIKKRKVK